ncbi:MAG: GTP-binding protein [Bacteroidales bacterium]
MDQGPAVKKTPLILVTGFLGSGKTSLLCDLLQRYPGQWRIAVIQNEFAPGRVDGITLRQTKAPFDLLEINNGSLFCACQLGDFITRLEPFLDLARPDLILMEATGLADPVSLGQILHSGNLADRIYLAAVWCVIDAANFLKIIDTVSRSRQQARLADLILINKTDLVPDTLALRQRISDLNPLAPLIETSFGATGGIDLARLLEAGEVHSDHLITNGVSEERPPISSCVVRSNRLFDAASTERFIRDQAPGLIRMKGYVRISPGQTLHVQTVYGEVNLLTVNDYEGPTELIALGGGLNRHDFSKQFLALPQNHS